MKRTSQEWSLEDDNLLKSLTEKGVKTAVIASTFNRTVSGIKWRASKLGVKIQEKRQKDVRKWNADEDKILKILRENGINSASIANALGRSKTSVVQRALKLNISFKKNKKELSQNQLDIIKKLKNKNKTWELISTNIIINKLAVNNFRIFNPVFPNSEEDLLIYNGVKFFKIQIKCASLIDVAETGTHWMNTSANFFHVEKGSNANTTNFKYPNIDFFIINCLGTDYTYTIPASVLKNRSKINLRYFPNSIRYYKQESLTIDTDKYLERYDLIK